MENNILLTTKTHFFTLDDKVLLFGVCLFVVNLSIPTFRAVVHFPRLPRRLQFSRSCHWYEGNGSSSICDWLIITSTSPYTVTCGKYATRVPDEVAYGIYEWFSSQ